MPPLVGCTAEQPCRSSRADSICVQLGMPWAHVVGGSFAKQLPPAQP
jgi:hypothetical protein